MDLTIQNGLYLLKIDKSTLALTKEEFLQALRRYKQLKRRQTLAPREALMRERADQVRMDR